MNKVLFLNPGEINTEAKLFATFKAGYESSGLTYSFANTPTAMLLNVSAANWVSQITSGIASGYNVFVNPTGDWRQNYRSFIPLFNRAISISGNGNINSECLFALPAGNNLYTEIINFNEDIIPITCAAGISTNDTSYGCEFYDRHFPYDTWAIHSISSLSNTSARVIVTTASVQAAGALIMLTEFVHISGVSGWPNNPNGTHVNLRYYDKDPYTNLTATPYYYNMFDIAWNLGSIDYLPTTGVVNKSYQSYSHSYITGKILAVKDILGCSFWEARRRCQITASFMEEYGQKDPINGYGVINIDKAVAYNGVIEKEPFFYPKLIDRNVTATLGGIIGENASYNLYVNQRYGTHFALYNSRKEFIQTLNTPQMLGDIYPLTNFSISNKSYEYRNYEYFIRVFNDERFVDTDLFVMPGRSKYKKIKIKLTKQYIQNVFNTGYGTNYGDNYGE